VHKLMVDELMSSLQLSMPYKQSCLSKTDMSKERLQQVDIPLKEEVNKEEEDFRDFKAEDLGIQV